MKGILIALVMLAGGCNLGLRELNQDDSGRGRRPPGGDADVDADADSDTDVIGELPVIQAADATCSGGDWTLTCRATDADGGNSLHPQQPGDVNAITGSGSPLGGPFPLSCSLAGGGFDCSGVAPAVQVACSNSPTVIFSFRVHDSDGNYSETVDVAGAVY